jgi:uncharacterized protein (TIGR03084 family)
MPGLIEDLSHDLRAETAEILHALNGLDGIHALNGLDGIRALDEIETVHGENGVDGLDDPAWMVITECAPWTVKDQLAHLAWNDHATVLALTEPERFVQAKPSTPEGIQAMVDSVISDNHHRSGPDVVHWFRNQRERMLEAVEGRDPRERIPWYGPDMSIASKLTARFMETWAHGYDITNALGVVRQPTDRLRHVVFLGLQALPNAFSAHGLAVPLAPVRVEVVAPSGELWSFGRAEAVDVVRGSAFDLAQVVTQRIDPATTTLRAEGVVAARWLSIAQAFAGPPGRKRGPDPTMRRETL